MEDQREQEHEPMYFDDSLETLMLSILGIIAIIIFALGAWFIFG